jgi:hypothetical protein
LKKSIWALISVILVITLAACERTATRSSWSLLNANQPTPSLEVTLETEIAIAVPQKSPTAVRVATLELSALAEKYPLAFKGYELLSWQKDGEWVFTLLAGTNRQKSFDEILNAENTFTATEIIKVSVIGADPFKELVNHLPKGEWITWGGMVLQGEVSPSTLYFTYPPDEIVDELIKYCKERGITLVTLKEE